MRKILVTGSREFTDWSIIQNALAVERWPAGQNNPASGDGHMLVIHGGAKGADSIAGDLARRAINVHEVIVPALWDKNGKGAGPQRNAAMMHLDPQVVLAFYKDSAKNIGTSDCVRRARSYDIEVKEFHQP